MEIPASPSFEDRIGRGIPELLFLEPHWRALAAHSPASRFIHAFEWQMAYLRHLSGNPEAIHYVSFFADGRPVAIFPLRRVLRSVGRIKLWLWELPVHPHLILCEPLLAPEWTDANLLRHLVKTLKRRTELSWDALHLPNLLDDSVAIRSLAARSPGLVHLERTGQSMYFCCDGMDRALANCSGQFKRNLRRQGRKLDRQGSVTLTLARHGSELDSAFEDFLRLEASGWKGKAGKGSAIGLHPHLIAFYQELKERFEPRAACLISVLKLNCRAVAAQFCLLAGNTLHIQKIAYDETWRAEAPGNQLLWRLLEYCCGEPEISRLSLVTAPGWAVGRWNPERQNIWEAYVFSPSPRGLGALTMRHLKTRLTAPAQTLWKSTRAALSRTGKPPAGGAAD